MRSRRFSYIQAFANGYRRGRLREKECVENRWLSAHRISVWYYKAEIIAVLLNHEQARWLYLRSASKNKPVFDRFDEIVRHFDLGIFSRGGCVPGKVWSFFPKDAQHFIPWKGQLIFKLGNNQLYNSSILTLSIADRLQAIIPATFTSNPFWEKDLSWKPVEHP